MEQWDSPTARQANGAAAAKPRAIALRPAWPQGAVTGLLLVALACAGVMVAAYRLLGPAQPIASEPAGADWSLAEASAERSHG